MTDVNVYCRKCGSEKAITTIVSDEGLATMYECYCKSCDYECSVLV